MRGKNSLDLYFLFFYRCIDRWMDGWMDDLEGITFLLGSWVGRYWRAGY